MNAPAPLYVTNRPLEVIEMAGRFAMEMGARPKFKFAVHDGDRRRFGERTARAALDLKIVEKENPK